MFQGSTSSLSVNYGRLKVETRKELLSSVDPKEPKTADSGKKGKLKSVTKETEETKDQEINSIIGHAKELRYFDPKVRIG